MNRKQGKFYKRMLLVLLSAGLLAIAGGCGNSKRLDNETAYRQIGLNALQSGDYEAAVTAFDNALAQHMGRITDLEIDICYYKALAQYKNGDVDDAIGTYTALIEYDKKNTKAYFLRGNLYLNEQKTQEALSDFVAATKTDNSDYEMYIEIADVLGAAGDTQNEQVYLNQALQIGGDDAASLRYQGIIAYRQGDITTATAKLNEAVKAGDNMASLELGKLYLEEGDTGLAQQNFQSYLEKHEDDTEALNQLGCLAAENGEYDTAVTYFEQGLSVENVSNGQELLRNVVAAYEYAGDFEKAKEKISEYLSLYPGDEEAVRESTFLETR